jgi:multiple antibiotic resistance protein
MYKENIMAELSSFTLFALTSFFTLINPLGVMPIFLTITSDLEEDERRATAKKAVGISFMILIIFALTGQMLFRFFNISVNSLKIVGGIIFFFMGQDMLQARLTNNSNIENKDVTEYVRDISITPLAIPMITGPGAITNAIVMMENATEISRKFILLIVIFLVCLITYLILINSSKILKILGPTGNIVMMRLMGLIVMVIAVEFFFAGLKPILREILML